MRYLRTNTATRITVGPFLDKTDGITPETALTVTNEKLTFMVDTAGVPTLVLDTAPTASGGNNDMVHVTGDDAGFYDLELAAADVNYLGRAMLALTDATNHCPVFHEFMILPAMIYDSLVLGTDRLDTNVTHIADTSQTARDIGASVLLSSGTGTGQLDFTSGVVKANATQWVGGTIPAVNVTGVPLVDAKYLLGTVFSTPTVAGIPNVNVKTWNDLTTVALPLVPTVAGRTLDVSAGGEAGMDWANVGGQSTSVNLSATTTNIVNTVTTYTGNTPQTGDSYARIGATGSGLTTLATAASIAALNNLSSTDVATAVWNAETATYGSAGSYGLLLETNIDAAISSRLSSAGYTAPDNSSITAIKAKTDNLPASPAAVGDIPTAAQNATAVLTTQMTESYAADGVAPTLAQAIFLTQQSLTEASISSTTLTVKKLDGSTTAATFTLDSATAPTSRTRAT